MSPADALSRKNFPADFAFGAASSAYQCEGGASEGGKGLSNWDIYTHKFPDKIDDGSNGDVAVDSYHRYKEDVSIMKDMGLDAYRFSIAWSRILPNGTLNGGINEEGIRYYNNLINELLSQGIEPFPTLFHWDVPQALEEKYHGFLSPCIIDDFGDYAEVCYKAFGDRVKHWMTLNEPWTFSYGGYVKGFFPPGNVNNSGTEPYIESQKGQIGIALNYFWMVPFSENQADIIAAEKASDFMFGWFVDPITYGEYPKCMRSLVKERLPNFTNKQSQMLKGSYDFLGLNYYTANYATHAPTNDNGATCYSTDSCCTLSSDCYKIPIGEPTASDWLYIYPSGIRDILLHIKRKYNNPIIYVTENGISNDGKLPLDEALKDDQRTQAYVDHLSYLQKAIEEGVDVKGFFVWSLLDNFEWNCGYTVRFGIYYVDFKDGLKRHPKKSAIWFKSFLKK